MFKKSKFKNLFISGTMRTGGSLVSNILSAHKDVIILHDILHFFRFIYKRYKPIYKNEVQYQLCGELSLRLRLRDEIKIDKDKFYKEFKKNNVKDYNGVYYSLFNVLLKEIPQKKIIGEYANGHWQDIENFLSFDKQNRAIQVIRDPRGVVSSWKKITFSKKYKYLNSIFNWIHSFDTSNKLLKKYSKKRYLLIKFEDIHRNPKKVSEKLCKFLEIKFDKNMTSPLRWKKIFRNRFFYLNESAYDHKKKVYGFSIKRNDLWKNYLNSWEVNLINHLCGSRMKSLGYQEINQNKELIKIGLKNINKDKILKKNYSYLKKRKIGSSISYFNDPTNPLNWESRIKPGTKFVNGPEYKEYVKELKNVKKIAKSLIK